MKTLSVFFLSSFVLLTALTALASEKVEYIRSRGYASGFCQANSGSYCVRNLEYSASVDGERDANMQCRSLNGRLQPGTISSCFFTSSPSYIPPNNPPTYVTVNASCEFRCDIQIKD